MACAGSSGCKFAGTEYVATSLGQLIFKSVALSELPSLKVAIVGGSLEYRDDDELKSLPNLIRFLPKNSQIG